MREMQPPCRRRGRDERDDENFDRQRDRKQRRRMERLERKRARIESHERWVEQRRLLKAKRCEGRGVGPRGRDGSRRGLGATPLASRTAEKSAHATANGDATRSSQGCPAGAKKSLRRCEEERRSAVPEETMTTASNKASAGVAISPTTVETAPGKYTPPTLRNKLAEERNTTLDDFTRRIINKLTVRNVTDMTREVSELFGGVVKGATRASVLRSLTRHICRMCMSDDVPLTPIVSLPFAGLVRGLQLLHGNVVGAEMIEGLCLALQEHLQSGNETSASNGAMILAYLYILNAVDSLLVSTFLRSVLQVGSPGAVCAAACGLTLLRACGEKLLKEAPGQMEQALAEAKIYGGEQQGDTRCKALLGYITDIVAGRTRSAKRAMDEEEVPVESLLSDMATLLPGGDAPNNKRVLHRIMSTASVLTGVTWACMVRSDKPSRWFVPGAWDHEDGSDNPNGQHEKNVEEAFSSASSATASADDADEEANLKADRIRQMRQETKAISGQRLNTENKREVFRCIANASDDLEAFTLLMHRDPSFSRLHDTLAVLLQCAYQEKVYNPYYAQVIQRFCSAKTSCTNTLQFALWDLFKMIRVEAVDVAGYLNLSSLLAHLIEGGVFTLSVLRGLDLDSTNRTIGLFTRILLLRLIFQLPPAKLVEVFFGGDGLRAHDVKIDTSVLRSNLAVLMERYFVDERESAKWIPHFYDVVAAGTPFDVRRRSGGGTGGRAETMDEEACFQSFMKRVNAVFKALKKGIS